MNIIDELRKIRIEQGLTQADVAVATKTIESHQISSWESGKYNPSYTSLVCWAAALGYELDLILIKEIKPPRQFKETGHDSI